MSINKETLKEKALTKIIKLLDLTKPVPFDLPADIRNLVEERLRETTRIIENWVIKTFVSKGIVLPSGKRHGFHSHGYTLDTPSTYLTHACYWFGKEHGFVYQDMDIDMPEYSNYYLGKPHGPFLCQITQSGTLKYKNYQYGNCIYEKLINLDDDYWDERNNAIKGPDGIFLVEISRIPVLYSAGVIIHPPY